MDDRDELFKRYAKENPSVVSRMESILGRSYNCERSVKAAVALRTYIPRLDLALYGGIPSGVSEIFGPESSGKTALLGAILAAAQKQGKDTALVATEDLDTDYWGALGVDLNKLLLFEVEDVRDAVHLVSEFVHKPGCVLGIDSITALRSMDDSGSLEDFYSWKDTVRTMIQLVNERVSIHSALVVTSQVRARRSTDHHRTFAGGTESASRGVLDEFLLRLELSRQEVHDASYTMVVNVVANVLGPPARFIKLPVNKGSGVDHDLDLIEVAAELGLVERKGTWYRLDDEGRMYHGVHAAAQVLKDQPWRRDLLLSDRHGIYQHLC